MQQLRTSVLLSLLLFSIFSCKNNDELTPDTCKLTTIDRGNSNKHTYTYDSQGLITQMTRDFDGDGSGKLSRFVYTFTRDAQNQVIKSTITLDGKAYSTETYTYTNGLITKTAYTNTDGSKGINNIKYNAAGLITEFTFESGDANSDGKQYFEYSADNIMTKRGYADLQGNSFFEVRYSPIGKVSSPEQLLRKHGLPYDFLTGFSWSATVGNVGSTYEVFYADDKTGKLVSAGAAETGKTTDVKTNSKGYEISETSVDGSKQTITQVFTLIDCN